MAQLDRVLEPEDAQSQPPAAPWQPPSPEEAMPVEQDTPEQRPDEPANEGAADAQHAQPQPQEEKDEQNWWDKPVDAPDANAPGEMSERYAERDRPTEEPAPRDASAASDGKPTPRESLREHQERMRRALTENSNRVAQTRQQAGALAQQMRQAMSQESQPQSPSPGGAADNASNNARPQDNPLRGLLSSPNAQRMRAMATRAAALRLGRTAQADGQGAGEGEMTGPAHTAPVLSLPLGAVESGPASSEATYRLPPALRQPMREGMREAGPAAYQPMIDAYYRELSESSRTE